MSGVPSVSRVETVAAGGRLFIDEAGEERALLVLGHGAGGGVDAPDLAALAAALPERGVTVIRFEQPWRATGRKVAPAPAVLDAAWGPGLRAAVALFPGLPFAVGGRSAGSRVACRTSLDPALPAVAGVVALAFPLHPPGRPDRSRAEELAGVTAPVLVVQGERDTFGSPDEVRAAVALPEGRLLALPRAGHDLRAPATGTPTTADLHALLVETVTAFVLEVAPHAPAPSSA